MIDKKISIIIPYYNGGDFYFNLIDSLLDATQRVSFSFEIITIIDSVATTFDFISEKLKLLELKTTVEFQTVKNNVNIGVAASRNIAMDLASGDFFHIIDQDDAIKPGFYSAIQNELDDYNFIVMNGRVVYDNDAYKPYSLYYIEPELTLPSLIADDFIRSPGQVIFSRELAKKIYFPVQKQFKGADDKFFWIRLFAENQDLIKPLYIHWPNYIANIHANNYSSDADNLKSSALEGWRLVKDDSNLKNYRSLINKDINRLKFLLNEPLSPLNNIIGFFSSVAYFVKLNKLVRFLVKRRIW